MDTFTKEELYNTEISWWRNTRLTTECCEITIQSALDAIKNGKYKHDIEAIRRHKKNGDNETAQNIKMMLPSVTFAGIFDHGRKESNCVKYNYIMVLDFDHIPDNEMPQYKGFLQQDQFVIAFWQSPSGNGWKGIVALSNNQIDFFNRKIFHKNAFIQLEEHFKQTYNIQLDESGSDIPRPCFLSYDSDIVIKEQSQKFYVNPDVVIPKKTNKTKSLNDEDDLQINFDRVSDWNHLNQIVERKPESHDRNKPMMEKIVKFLEKKQLSITYNYEQWVCVAFAIATTFHYDYGRKIFMRLCRLDADKFDEGKSDKLLFNAYTENRGQRTFKTILYYAKQKGWIIKPRASL